MAIDKFIVAAYFFRFYQDGTEAGSTALADEDININVDVSDGDVQVQLRYSVVEVGSGFVSGNSTDDYGLERNSSSDGINTAITVSSSKVKADTGSSLTDGDPTTNRTVEGLTDGPGDWFPGIIEAANGEITDFLHAADSYIEHVWCLLIIADDVDDAETLDFRIIRNGGDPGLNNTVTPRITITKSSVPLTASGTPVIEEITASGQSTQTYKASGDPSIAEILASGVVDQIQKLSGTPSIETVSAVGVSRIIKKSSGAVTLPEVEAVGIVIQTKKASGSLSIEEITAAGIATVIRPLIPSDGTPSIATIEVSGISTIIVDPVSIRTPTINYSGKIDLDLARPGDIRDPATDRAILFLHDAVEQLSLSIVEELAAIAKGYGGIEQTGTPGISDLGAGFQVIPADAGLITTPIGVTQDFDNDGMKFENSGVWNINIIISLSHNQDNASRTIEVQLYNSTDAVEIEAIPVPVARDQLTTLISLIFMTEIPDSAEDDLLQIRIGNGSTITSVVLEAYQFSANYVSEFMG